MSEYKKLRGINKRRNHKSRVLRAAILYLEENGPSTTQRILNNMTYREAIYPNRRTGGTLKKGRSVLVKTTKSCPSSNQLAAKLTRHSAVKVVHKKRGEPTVWGLVDNHERFLEDSYRFGA
tara:strand:+ start:6179 stop:6541 length:363 start_codon:yes stop_codon:yes gene_type:complete